MKKSNENGIYYDPEIAQFYDGSNRARPDFDFCRVLAKDVDSILDLGCGTGDLAISLAAESSVVAVDPAAPMLEIANGKPGADRVTWYQSDAKTLRLNQKFDLIVLTGHTFQVFLNTADQRSVLTTISSHLKKNGRFIFDTRNPSFAGSKERIRGQVKRSFEHIQLGLIKAWNSSTYDQDSQVLSYENGFEVTASGKVHSAKAQIKYTSQNDVAQIVEGAGLEVNSWFGDWSGGAFHTGAPEIIPLGGLSE
ncbi:MAG: class I SAM-dependent methyltransferase [Hyphomicrobiales bacterium]